MLGTILPSPQCYRCAVRRKLAEIGAVLCVTTYGMVQVLTDRIALFPPVA